eukprot:CCRYP_005289-RA/>CCRYP_005289-RA protein AED:0.65 eAED:1.00 QI:0/0/0/1/0/0/2/0/99
MYQETSKEPQSTLEATKRLIKILDAKYEKADLRAIVRDNCTRLSGPEQARLLELLQEFEELISAGLPPVKGRSKAISWQAFSHTQEAHRNHKKRGTKTM